ncbi:MAG TPA: methionine adenosyltransferase [Thermodesulfobacteriota bacterium]|nr:methionine adenosyltransferase [Thermodesulfobacteriota bacterium]
MERFSFEIIKNTPTHRQNVEIVERKGVGHPDYICDAVMENISVSLSREYLKEFGEVLHHNIDKGLLVAGEVEKDFRGGRVITPMEFIIGDRATFTVGKKKVPVKEIAVESVGRWIKENLRRVDPKRHVRVRVVLKPGSAELTGIFKGTGGKGGKGGRVRGANDTSAAVGYAPFTPAEKAVYECERFLNSAAFKTNFPSTGEDVKVMGFRCGNELDLTVAMPLIAGEVRSEKEYFDIKGAIIRELRDFTRVLPFKKVKINYNTLDKRGKGKEGVYLSLLGTSAEDADSGQVGRGNRTNGVISLNRPMGTEAAAGKNPVSHVGKIYSVLSHRMASEIYSRIEGISEVYVWLLSQIGSPIDTPKSVSVQIVPEKKLKPSGVKKAVEEIVSEFLSGIGHFTGELTRGEHPIC